MNDIYLSVSKTGHKPTRRSNKLPGLKGSSSQSSGEGQGTEAGSRGLVHLMPRRGLAWLPFVAESVGQEQTELCRTLFVPSPLAGSKTKPSSARTPR